MEKNNTEIDLNALFKSLINITLQCLNEADHPNETEMTTIINEMREKCLIKFRMGN